jgi:hypothetical protein
MRPLFVSSGAGRGVALLLITSAVFALGGCARQAPSAADGEALPEVNFLDLPAGAPASAPKAAQGIGARNRNGSQLAYAHEVRVRLDAARIAQGLAAVHEACVSARFGQCDVLEEELSAGENPSGTLTVRAVPEAIDGLVGLAAKGGEVAQRSTTADDLADAVRDNGLRQQRLHLQHDKLGAILERKDLKVADLISVTERMAGIEAELQSLEQEAAQHARRIATNRLTLVFESAGLSASTSKVGKSFRDASSVLDASVAALVTIIGAALPFAVFAGLVAWMVRVWRRRRPRPV